MDLDIILKCESMLVSVRIWTRVYWFRDSRANHYTADTLYVTEEFSYIQIAAPASSLRCLSGFRLTCQSFSCLFFFLMIITIYSLQEGAQNDYMSFRNVIFKNHDLTWFPDTLNRTILSLILVISITNLYCICILYRI